MRPTLRSGFPVRDVRAYARERGKREKRTPASAGFVGSPGVGGTLAASAAAAGSEGPGLSQLPILPKGKQK
jgi:hypothetical protein